MSPASLMGLAVLKDVPYRLLVVLVILIVVVRLLGTRTLGAANARIRTGFHRNDQRTRLDLGSRVEHHDGFPGGAQQPLLFEDLEHASGHLAGTTDQAGQLLPAALDLHSFGI